MRVRNWNYDKPHRCPECHAVWTWSAEYDSDMTPRWWRTYVCYRCGTEFSGRRAWVDRLRDKARGRFNYSRREWRMRRGK